MSQITQITPQRKKGFFNIFVNGKFAFGLDEESLIKTKIHEGDELSVDTVEQFKKTAAFTKILNRVLSFLSYRPRSRKEIERYLATRLREKLDQPTVQQVIKKLTSWGYLNDEEFTRWLIDQRLGSKNPKGPIAIRRELLQKGIDRQLIDSLLAEIGKQIDQSSLFQLLAKRDRLLKGLGPMPRRQKLLAVLLRRGFDYLQSRRVVEKYLAGG